MKALTLLGLLALAACGAAGTARECAYDAQLTFSRATILAMDPADRRELLRHNREASTVCSH